MKSIIELRTPAWVIYKDDAGKPMPEHSLARFAGILEGDNEPVLLEVDNETGEFFDPTSIANFGCFWFGDIAPTAAELIQYFPALKTGSLGKA